MSRQFRTYGVVALVVALLVYLGLSLIFSWQIFTKYLIAVSTATFVLYGLDKLDAVRHGSGARHRVPKNLLHLLALLGGFLGGWLGMFVFWHKVRQPEFWVVLIFSSCLYLALFIFVG